MACAHIDQIRIVEPPQDIAGCKECLKSGGTWMHLRMCQTCGEIGCCDSSPNKHASRHAKDEQHPIAKSVEPGEGWSWCYVDEEMFRITAV